MVTCCDEIRWGERGFTHRFASRAELVEATSPEADPFPFGFLGPPGEDPFCGGDLSGGRPYRKLGTLNWPACGGNIPGG